MKNYLSTMFLITAITLTLSGCKDVKDKQQGYDYAGKAEQSMEVDYEVQSDLNDVKSYVFESDSEEVYNSLLNADAKLKGLLEEETLSQRLINSGNEMTREKAEHIDNLSVSITEIISRYIEAIENGDKETCDKCNVALSQVYDLYNEIYDVVIRSKIPEGNDVHLVGDIDFENTILSGPYMPIFSNNNSLPATSWLANMDEDIFDEYVVVDNTDKDSYTTTSYIVDVNDYNDRLSKRLLAIKEEYSDIYGFNPENVDIRWIGSEEDGSYGFVDKDTKEPYGLIDELTSNEVNAVIQDQLNLENRKINVKAYEQLLRKEKKLGTHQKSL